MKVKLFDGDCYSKTLQQNINEWLGANKGISIITITQSYATNDLGHNSMLISIWYK